MKTFSITYIVDNNSGQDEREFRSIVSAFSPMIDEIVSKWGQYPTEITIKEVEG